MNAATAPRNHQGLSATAALALALLALPVLALALDSDQEQPVYLEADSAELDEAKATSLYTGNVHIRQGSMEIRADQVIMHHEPDRRPRLITALGAPAKYRQEVDGEKQEVQAEALRMEYDTQKDEITLIDQALLFQGEDTFRSDRIVYDRAKALVKAGAGAQGKERVKIRINPAQR